MHAETVPGDAWEGNTGKVVWGPSPSLITSALTVGFFRLCRSTWFVYTQSVRGLLPPWELHVPFAPFSSHEENITMKRLVKKLVKWLLTFSFIDHLVYRVVPYWISFTQDTKRNLFKWHIVPPCPLRLYDAGGVQIGHRLYIVCGYSNLDEVQNSMEVLNLERNRWENRIEAPEDMAQSHLAIGTDGQRFIYVVSGQHGSQCSPAIREGFIYDTKNETWGSLPLLPEARYAATMQLWNGRLHLVGGSKEDRYTPSMDHWSIAVDGGGATESNWRKELPIPLGGCHRGSAIIDNVFYVFGAQQGDFAAIPEDPKYTCTDATVEHYSTECYCLRQDASEWQRLPDMPVSSSHIDYSISVVGGTAVLVGGQVYKDPFSFSLKLTDCIQAYDTKNGTWKILGRLPYRIKTVVTGYHDGWLYAMTGQRGKSFSNASPGRVVNDVWRTRLDTLL